MSGKKGRSGRKPLSLAAHVLANTYRRDRHGPLVPGGLPPVTAASSPGTPGPDVTVMLAGLTAAGRALVLAHLQGFDDWTARDLALLRQAGEARDRQSALQREIDAAGGVAVDGKPHPLLRAERQAGAAVVTALRCLDIHPAPARPAERRA